MNHFDFTFIDLFGGIGGFHIALKKLGGKCVLYSDIDKKASIVYKKNFNIDNSGDIRKLDLTKIPDFDVLCAGFPCQSFSNAGHKKAFNDERGLLFNNIINIIEIKRPKICILENVKHIKKVSDGQVYKYIIDKLNDQNYDVYDEIHNVIDFGIPQNRERCVFIAIHKNSFEHSSNILSYFKKFLPTIKRKLSIKFNNLYISKLTHIPDIYLDKYKISNKIDCIINTWDILIKQLPENTNISFPIIIDFWYTKFTKQKILEFPKWKQTYIKKNINFYNNNKDMLDKWYNTYSEHLVGRDIYRKLEWQVGKMKKNDSIYNYYIQFRQSGLRVKNTSYFPTLVAINQTSIIGSLKRYISPIECSFIQSFPLSFKIDDDDKSAYKQFGNAVNVDMIFTNMLCLLLTLRKFNILFFEKE
jgi:DNA (cytosine-5)-methyltransferase 1